MTAFGVWNGLADPWPQAAADDWPTPLEEMAGDNILALRLVRDAEACRELSHQSRRERLDGMAQLMADVEPLFDVAVAFAEALADAVWEWHSWDDVEDVKGRMVGPLGATVSRQQVDDNVLHFLAQCVLGAPPCETCVARHATVTGVCPQVVGSLECAAHRAESQEQRRRLTGRRAS